MNEFKLSQPISNIGELKEAIKDVPDDYPVSCMGVGFLVGVDEKEKAVLLDEEDFFQDYKG